LIIISEHAKVHIIFINKECKPV